MNLAREHGKSRKEILDMDAKELRLYRAYYNTRAFTHEMLEIYMAQVCTLLSQDTKIEDFYLSPANKPAKVSPSVSLKAWGANIQASKKRKAEKGK